MHDSFLKVIMRKFLMVALICVLMRTLLNSEDSVFVLHARKLND